MNNHCGKSKIGKWLMILCCTIPVIMVAVLLLTRGQGTSDRNLLSYGVLLLCPLSHLLLMPLMHRSMKNKEQSTDQDKPSCH